MALADRNFQQTLIEAGLEAGLEPDLDSTPEKFRRSLEDDIAHWTPIVNAIGLKIDSMVSRTPHASCLPFRESYRPMTIRVNERTRYRGSALRAKRKLACVSVCASA
jgi:hypothetical protein